MTQLYVLFVVVWVDSDRRMRPWLTWLLLGGCAASDAEFRVTRSPRFTPSGVSVFGVFKSGRLRAEYWDEIGDAISPVLNAHSCESVFGERLESADPALFEKLDEDSKEGGITPELLERIAPRAMGGLILAMRVTGRLREEEHAQRALALANRPPAGARSRPTPVAGKHAPDPVEDETFTLTLSLFSLEAHDFVAEVSLRYTGQSVEQALSRFAERVRAELPDLTCMGWKWP